MTVSIDNPEFVSLDTLTKGGFMHNQRLITGVELLPGGSEMQVVKVAEVTSELKL